MTLADLELLGAYHNAGYVDIYHGGKHTRLGSMTTGGDFVPTDEGRAFSDKLMTAKYAEILVDKEPVTDLSSLIAPVAAPVVEPVVVAVEPDVGDVDALDKLIAG